MSQYRSASHDQRLRRTPNHGLQVGGNGVEVLGSPAEAQKRGWDYPNTLPTAVIASGVVEYWDGDDNGVETVALDAAGSNDAETSFGDLDFQWTWATGSANGANVLASMPTGCSSTRSHGTPTPRCAKRSHSH